MNNLEYYSSVVLSLSSMIEEIDSIVNQLLKHKHLYVKNNFFDLLIYLSLLDRLLACLNHDLQKIYFLIKD